MVHDEVSAAGGNTSDDVPASSERTKDLSAPYKFDRFTSRSLEENLAF
ncbi:jg2459, partial [Pararge aegeria aegeria]